MRPIPKKDLYVSAVGFKFLDATPGDVNEGTLSLLPEPSNEYDPNAIKLMLLRDEEQKEAEESDEN